MWDFETPSPSGARPPKSHSIAAFRQPPSSEKQARRWVAFLVGAPASAAFVGALGTVISALSRDVRTSMQYTSFFIGLLSLGIGFMRELNRSCRFPHPLLR